MAGPVNPLQFMPSQIVKSYMNEKFGGPANWFCAVNGVYIPTEMVRTNLPEPDRDRIRLDPRMPAVATYPTIAGAEFSVELDVPSYQQDVETRLYGKTLKDFAATNTFRQVGTLAVPTATSHCEWFLLKASASGSNKQVTIPRLDFQGHDASTSKYYYYNYASGAVSLVTTMSPAGVISFPNDNSQWIGEVNIAGFNPTLITYDSNTNYRVSFSSGVDQLVIDQRHIDPNLVDGDSALIVGASYKFLQLAEANSYSYLFRMFEASEVPIDLYMSLGRSARSRVLLSRHIQRAQLLNIPDFGETSGTKAEHNRRTFRFEIVQYENQNATIKTLVSDLFQESVHIITS